MTERIKHYRNASLEHNLSSFYDPDTYARLGTKITDRAGPVSILTTNERFLAENLAIDPKPDGYVIGTGNGAIWRMLDLFPKDTQPKGIISIDRDPSVILSGKVLIELAKRNIPPEEAVAYFYGVHAETGVTHTLDDLISVARDVAQKEPNPTLKRTLLETIHNEHFLHDMKLIHGAAANPSLLHKRGRKSMAEEFFRYWPAIVQLARQGNVFFVHADIGNRDMLRFLTDKIPDIASSRNVLYVSNLCDRTYQKDLNGLQILNPSGRSWYVFTNETDEYMLRASHEPPALGLPAFTLFSHGSRSVGLPYAPHAKRG